MRSYIKNQHVCFLQNLGSSYKNLTEIQRNRTRILLDLTAIFFDLGSFDCTDGYDIYIKVTVSPKTVEYLSSHSVRGTKRKVLVLWNGMSKK